ncbi:MAG: helix-hairpin-helix domain-containing protein [Candidatus Heimdallarchaeaceae archaeon]
MAINEIENINGIGPKAAKTLVDCGFNTIEKLAKATADELSQLPGIGKSTAEKMILSANEALTSKKKPVTKTVTKKAEVKPKTKKVDKESIPKPPALKKKADETSVRPSVKTTKPVAKTPPKKPVAKTPPKKPVAKIPPKKPAVKKPAAKSEVKKPIAKKPVVKPKAKVAVKTGISLAAIKAIEKATGMPRIKSKASKKKSKVKKKITLSKTYGIVHSVLHDASGRSSNRAVILHLYDMELPIYSYLGRKVSLTYAKSDKQLTGTISRVHGKKSSRNNAVIVRFQKGVSPHILSARATLK